MLERIADLIRPVIAARTYNGGFVVTPDMMSLAGCSGEEFAGLLQGLGYRVQRETIVPPPSGSEETPASKETTESATPQTTAEAALAAIVDAIAAPVAGSPTDAILAEPGTETPAAQDQIGAAETVTAEPAEPATSTVELEIWRPVRRRPEGKPARRRKPNKAKTATGETVEGPSEARGERHRKSKRKPDERGERHAKGGRPEVSGYREPRKPREREPDPDSPFAALAVLKERAGGN